MFSCILVPCWSGLAPKMATSQDDANFSSGNCESSLKFTNYALCGDPVGFLRWHLQGAFLHLWRIPVLAVSAKLPSPFPFGMRFFRSSFSCKMAAKRPAVSTSSCVEQDSAAMMVILTGPVEKHEKALRFNCSCRSKEKTTTRTPAFHSVALPLVGGFVKRG